MGEGFLMQFGSNIQLNLERQLPNIIKVNLFMKASNNNLPSVPPRDAL